MGEEPKTMHIRSVPEITKRRFSVLAKTYGLTNGQLLDCLIQLYESVRLDAESETLDEDWQEHAVALLKKAMPPD